VKYDASFEEGCGYGRELKELAMLKADLRHIFAEAWGVNGRIEKFG
jgi:hypothetical protein